MLKKTFGQLLREQHDDRQLSQERLAEAFELSAYYISVLEAGKQQPTLTTLFKFAEALNTTPEELVKIVRQRLPRAISI